MFTIANYSYESCAKKCRNRDHGEKISSVLTNERISDEKIAAYVGKTCRNFAHILDQQGQSALHIATAAHKYAIVEWLINNGADVNLPDEQLGQTALHRAIQYGYFDIAMLLISYGASFELIDTRLKSPVQYCCKPKNYVHEQSQIKEKNQLKEILVWGNNRNYNLGLENKEGKPYPYYLDCFAKQHVTISNVSLSSYHCLYVDDKGELYAVGLGDGGRLGTNNETTLVIPKKIYLTNKHKQEYVKCISTAKNHSIALTNEDRVFTCGLNTNGQLGQRNVVDKSLILRDIEIGDRGFKGVIAREYHSLAYTTNSIYVWGTNVGQFGTHTNDAKVLQPKKLETFSHLIDAVDSSDAAIVCLTTSGLILLYTKFKVKTLKKPILHESIRDLAIVGGDPILANPQEKAAASVPLEILILTESQSLFLWANEEQKYLRCYMPQPLSIQKIYWNARILFILTTDGTLYKGKITKQDTDSICNRGCEEEFVEQRSNRRTDISDNCKCEIELTRIPNVDRITNVAVDQRGESYVVLQENSKRYLPVPILPDDPITFKALLTEATEFDLLHDIVFHVDDEIFPAHKYIVFSRAEGLRDIIRKYKDKHIYLNYVGLTSKMFELIMKYIYENYELTMTDLEDIEASFDPYSGLTNLDICTLFREFLGKFGVSKFYDRMMSSTSAIKDPALKFNRLSYPELYDVTIQCADNKELKAHRCVLSTRLEYFNLMFNNSWSESTKNVISLTTVPHEYMEPILNFLYHNDANIIRKQQYTDSFLYHLMEICDQFFVNRLKNIIEIMMVEKLIARKCADMFEFAIVFNCHLLEAATLDYICQNMGRLLENRCLEHLQIESLEKISEYYKHLFQFNECDMVVNTLYGDMITDESVLKFCDDFYVDLYLKSVDGLPKQSAVTSKPKKSERSSSDRRNYEKEGINLVKNLSIEPEAPKSATKKVSTEVTSIIEEAEQISKVEAEKWMKVADKKDIKKKAVTAGLRANEVLKNEPRDQDNFTPLKPSRSKSTDEQIDFDKTLNSSTSSVTVESPSEKTITFNLSLGDFTPQKGGKLSQKQRRRQLSQSEHQPSVGTPGDVQSPPQTNFAWNAISTPTPVSPAEQANVWKIKSPPENRKSPADKMKNSEPSTSATAIAKTQPINIASSSKTSMNGNVSFNESFFSPSPTKSSFQSASVKSNESFTKILEDERKQKEYYQKMKSKSLLLTQIEETAISELKKFYNIDNVYDEHIEIERKSNINPTVNFASWKHE